MYVAVVADLEDIPATGHELEKLLSEEKVLLIVPHERGGGQSKKRQIDLHTEVGA